MDENVTTTDEATQEQTTPEVETTSTTEETQSKATQEPAESEAETTETEAGEQAKEAPKDWEKIAKDNQSAFTKVSQELAQLKKQVEQSQPKLVQQGRINPDFETNYKMQIDDYEYREYDNLARQLDTETRAVVEELLRDAKRLYSPRNKSAYEAKLGQIKDYFRSDLVIGIENKKQKYLGQMQETFNRELQKDKQIRADRVAAAIEAVPELNSLVAPESENYSPEVFGIVKTMFDLTGDVDIQATSNAISKIKELGVKEYLAKQGAKNASNNANVPEGETVIHKSSMPTAEEIRNTPGLYTKLAKKYGEAKVDKILMKG